MRKDIVFLGLTVGLGLLLALWHAAGSSETPPPAAKLPQRTAEAPKRIDPPKARAAAREIDHPEHREDSPHREVLKKSHELLSGGSLAAAIEVLEKALAEDPSSPELSLELALLLGQDPRQRDRAESLYRRVLENDPEHEVALTEILASLQARGDFDEGNRLLDELMRSRPDSPLLAAQKGSFLLEQGKIEDAISSYQRASQTPEFKEAALYGLAHAYSMSGEHGKSAAAYQELVLSLDQELKERERAGVPAEGLREELMASRFSLAVALIHNRQYDDAREILDKLSRLDPDHPEIASLRSLLAHVSPGS